MPLTAADGSSTLEQSGKARSPIVECKVLETTNAVVLYTDRSLCRDSMPATRWSSSARYGGAYTRVDNGTRVPQAETCYVLEHEANENRVEVGSRGHTCLTQRPVVQQCLEPTSFFATVFLQSFFNALMVSHVVRCKRWTRRRNRELWGINDYEIYVLDHMFVAQTVNDIASLTSVQYLFQ